MYPWPWLIRWYIQHRAHIQKRHIYIYIPTCMIYLLWQMNWYNLTKSKSDHNKRTRTAPPVGVTRHGSTFVALCRVQLDIPRWIFNAVLHCPIWQSTLAVHLDIDTTELQSEILGGAYQLWQFIKTTWGKSNTEIRNRGGTARRTRTPHATNATQMTAACISLNVFSSSAKSASELNRT